MKTFNTDTDVKIKVLAKAKRSNEVLSLEKTTGAIGIGFNISNMVNELLEKLASGDEKDELMDVDVEVYVDEEFRKGFNYNITSYTEPKLNL